MSLSFPPQLLHTAYTSQKDRMTAYNVIQEGRGDQKGKGKRPRIDDDDDDDDDVPVVAVKRPKRVPFTVEEVQQIKTYMEGHGGKGS